MSLEDIRLTALRSGPVYVSPTVEPKTVIDAAYLLKVTESVIAKDRDLWPCRTETYTYRQYESVKGRTGIRFYIDGTRAVKTDWLSYRRDYRRQNGTSALRPKDF